VFILGTVASGDPRAAAERAGEILAVGTRCEWHPATRGEARADLAGTLGGGTGSRGWAQDTERMTFVAAPLSHGSNPNSNMAGRRREGDENLVAFHATQDPISGDISPAMGAEESGAVAVSMDTSVRRLTPRECERLQALPDDWTAFGPDSRRYAALGDAVTASVAEWIGRRLDDGTTVWLHRRR
jgi:DNA (cytosine-5)-methyltransferase 1